MIWFSASTRADFAWPDRIVRLPFEQYEVQLSPDTPDELAGTAIRKSDGSDDLSFEEGGSVLSRFLSRLAWSRDGAIDVVFECSGSNHPEKPMSLSRKHSYVTPSDYREFEPAASMYLPLPPKKDGDLALALYREGLVFNRGPYGLLNFFKILNIGLSNGKSQTDWINNNVHMITDRCRCFKILEEVAKDEKDIGKYLYIQGRCAVAHAFSAPLINPDEYQDRQRLQGDAVLMRDFAALYIENELGIPRYPKFWKLWNESPQQTNHGLVYELDRESNPLTYRIHNGHI